MKAFIYSIILNTLPEASSGVTEGNYLPPVKYKNNVVVDVDTLIHDTDTV